jgi:hypothetical protein
MDSISPGQIYIDGGTVGFVPSKGHVGLVDININPGAVAFHSRVRLSSGLRKSQAGANSGDYGRDQGKAADKGLPPPIAPF